jgi:hypothetical protein
LATRPLAVEEILDLVAGQRLELRPAGQQVQFSRLEDVAAS